MIRAPQQHEPFPLCVLRQRPIVPPQPTVPVGATTAVTVRPKIIRVRRDGFRSATPSRSEGT